MQQLTKDSVKIHGHRGWRGRYPENTIYALSAATKLGVDAIEVDVVMMKNGEILISHDPYMHREICSGPDGKAIAATEESLYNIYEMSADMIKTFQCGAFPHPRFPSQKQIPGLYKPMLVEAVKAIRELSQLLGRNEPLWNIEIKSHPDWDFIFQPEPAEYIKQFLAEFELLNFSENCVIQSFDKRILRELHHKAPLQKLVLLIDAFGKSPQEELSDLGFVPYGYSPNYKIVDAATAVYCIENNIELITWTVNNPAEMKAMMVLGVKHIITDYPDIAMKLREEGFSG